MAADGQRIAELRSGHAEDAWRWIENDQHRRVTLDGTKEEQFKTNGAVDFRPLDIGEVADAE